MSEDEKGKKTKRMSIMSDTRGPLWGEGDDLKREDETLDTLFEGKLKLFQGRRGYRFSLDALLLAQFMTRRRGEKIADLGTGNGVIALILAFLDASLWITGMESQPSMIDRAKRNVRLNEFQQRVTIKEADVAGVKKAFRPESFAAVVCNPPFRQMTSGRISATTERKIARHEITAGLADFLHAGAYLLPIKGRMAVIYPASRLVDVLTSMRDANLEPKRLRMVHSFGDATASLVLVEGVKGGSSGVAVLSPLIVYQKEKQYSAEVEAMLAGKGAGS